MQAKKVNKQKVYEILKRVMYIGYVTTKEKAKDDELVLMSPTVLKLSEDNNTVVGV